MSEIVLNSMIIPAVPSCVEKHGGLDFDIEDQKLKIQNGNDVLFHKGPEEGKKWKVSLMLDIKETNI